MNQTQQHDFLVKITKSILNIPDHEEELKDCFDSKMFKETCETEEAEQNYLQEEEEQEEN